MLVGATLFIFGLTGAILLWLPVFGLPELPDTFESTIEYFLPSSLTSGFIIFLIGLVARLFLPSQYTASFSASSDGEKDREYSFWWKTLIFTLCIYFFVLIPFSIGLVSVTQESVGIVICLALSPFFLSGICLAVAQYFYENAKKQLAVQVLKIPFYYGLISIVSFFIVPYFID